MAEPTRGRRDREVLRRRGAPLAGAPLRRDRRRPARARRSSLERDGAAERVEGLEPRLCDRRAVELVGEDGEGDRVARRFALPCREPPAQRRLLREAEGARDAQARLVGGIDPDLDAVDAADADRDPRERGRRFARIAATDRRGADPVADLERSLAGARVEPRAADGLAFVARGDAVDEILPELEPS